MRFDGQPGPDTHAAVNHPRRRPLAIRLCDDDTVSDTDDTPWLVSLSDGAGWESPDLMPVRRGETVVIPVRVPRGPGVHVDRFLLRRRGGEPVTGALSEVEYFWPSEGHTYSLRLPDEAFDECERAGAIAPDGA